MKAQISYYLQLKQFSKIPTNKVTKSENASYKENALDMQIYQSCKTHQNHLININLAFKVIFLTPQPLHHNPNTPLHNQILY